MVNDQALIPDERPDAKSEMCDRTNRVEGPTAIKNGGGHYIYFDHHSNPKYHGAIKSTDMKTWQDISPALSFPRGIRHGTVSTVPESVVQQSKTTDTNKQMPI